MKRIRRARAFRTFAATLLASGWAAWAAAADIACEPNHVVRCACPASMSVKCADGRTGYIDDGLKASQITLKVFDPATGEAQSVTLLNPPDGIRSYHTSSLGYDEWIKKMLAAKGVDSGGKKLVLEGFKTSSTTQLYQDPDKKTPLSAEDSSAVSACDYVEKPSIVTTQACREKICVANVRCKVEGSPVAAVVGCKALPDGSCPTADVCSGDESVAIDFASVSSGSTGNPGARGSKTSGSTSVR